MVKQATVEITVGKYRNDTSWIRKKVLWTTFLANLAPDGLWFTRTREKYKEYLELPKDRQDEIKDVGGFVGGLLTGGRRKKANVICRTLVTLDIDHMTPDEGRTFWKLFCLTYDCAAVLYSTHKHSPETPRYRLIIPLSRNVTVEEYQAIARRIAGYMGIDMFDHTGFQEERLMYFPSCSRDAPYVYKVQDGDALDADQVLDSYGIGPDDDLNATERLTGWQDSSQWPVCSREQKRVDKSAAVQGNPLEKPGIVGAFCRTFTIPEAIETFLPGVYREVEGMQDRYTYIHGSTSAGAIVYRDEEDNPVFLYSHHGTDPINTGHLYNAFDLVRVHKFGLKDEKHDNQEDVTKLPSYEHMREYATRNPAVAARIRQDRMDATQEAFRNVILPEDIADEVKADADADRADLAGSEDRTVVEPAVGSKAQERKLTAAPEADGADTETAVKWTRELEVNGKGVILSTIDNVVLVLENDPHFKDRLWFDQFRSRYIIRGRLPWRRVKEFSNQWTDEDGAAFRHYLERVYQIGGREKIEDALRTLMTRKTVHPVKDMLKSVDWDGVKRIDRLLIDYLGAEDNEYVRTVTRKTMVAAVTRIMRPGIKFDNVLTLVGEEGKMKSMLFDLLAYPWFSDSLTTVQGKEAFEQIHGYWIIELGEMSALSRAENEQVKHFLSKRVDSYRAPYGRNMVDYPRSNIFVASTNKLRFLKGLGGDRRFWPVEIDVYPPKYKVSSLKDDRDTVLQIWAEAMAAFRDGETLFLADRLYYAAKEVQEQHTEQDARASVVHEYLDMDLPADWYELETAMRRPYVKGEIETGKKTFKRDKVCIREIWTECFGKAIGDLNKRESDALAHIMDHAPGWKKAKGVIRIRGMVGTHRGWVRDHFDKN